MHHRFTDTLVKALARMIRGWRKMSGRARTLIFGGIGTVIIALVLLLIFMQPSARAEGAIAQATPLPTLPPVATPLPTPVPTTPPEESMDVTMQFGDQNENVTVLQERLMDLGYLDIDEATDYFGPATKYAVQLFQRQNELEQDGIADYDIQMLLFSDDAKHYAILTGMSGDDVANMQRQLIDLGYLSSGKATGFYGEGTTEAIKAFQKANKLTVDGKTGPQTMDHLYSPDAIATPEKRNALRTKANISQMIAAAESKLGKPYVWGAKGPNSFDCSGLVYYCLKQAGSNRGRYNAAGYSKVSDWKLISSMNSLKRGDLIFFYDRAKTRVGHVAIYIGNGYMIDASSSHGEVVKRKCLTSYWRGMFIRARRPW